VRYELDSVGDLAALWRALQLAEARSKPVQQGSLYPLRRSAAAQDAVREKLPEPLRAQMEQYEAMMSSTDQGRTLLAPRQVLAKHKLVRASAQLMGVREPGHQFE
jgi:hypothetical protein